MRSFIASLAAAHRTATSLIVSAALIASIAALCAVALPPGAGAAIRGSEAPVRLPDDAPSAE